LLVPLVPVVQAQLDRRIVKPSAEDEVLYLWSADQVRWIAPGLESLAADVYWLRTVQYFGSQRAYAAGSDFRLLKPLIDMTVALDPRMEIAYRYGAIFLAEPRPGGAGQPEAAIDLLERGAQALPGDWRLRQDLGFSHFLFLHDPRTASRILEEASDLPGAPGWLRNLAADVLTKGGDAATARQVWERIRDQSDGQLKYNARLQIAMIDALEQAERLTSLVHDFEKRTGRRPASLEELVAAGALTRAPLDAAGIPFQYDATTAAVTVSRRSPLWRQKT